MQSSHAAFRQLKRPAAVPVQILIENGVPTQKTAPSSSIFGLGLKRARQGFKSFKSQAERPKNNTIVTENIHLSHASHSAGIAQPFGNPMHYLANLQEPSLFKYLLSLQHQAQVYHQQTGQALANYLPPSALNSTAKLAPKFQQREEECSQNNQFALDKNSIRITNAELA